MNEQNLVNFTSDQSREEAAKNGRKGGIASGKARRDKRTFRETLKLLLAMPDKNKKGEPLISPITGKPMSIQESLVYQTIRKGRDGDLKAISLALNVLGELTQNINQEVTIKKDKYDDMNEDELRAEAERITKSMEK